MICARSLIFKITSGCSPSIFRALFDCGAIPLLSGAVVAHCHAHSMLHRGLKLERVLFVTDGHLLVADLGS
jgi:serine/threonine protein kinase